MDSTEPAVVASGQLRRLGPRFCGRNSYVRRHHLTMTVVRRSHCLLVAVCKAAPGPTSTTIEISSSDQRMDVAAVLPPTARATSATVARTPTPAMRLVTRTWRCVHRGMLSIMRTPMSGAMRGRANPPMPRSSKMIAAAFHPVEPAEPAEPAGLELIKAIWQPLVILTRVSNEE